MNPIHIATKKLMAANILVFITISRGRELKSACRRAGGEVIGGEVEPATSNNSDDIFMVLPATSLSWRVDMDKVMIALVGRTTPPKLSGASVSHLGRTWDPRKGIVPLKPADDSDRQRQKGRRNARARGMHPLRRDPTQPQTL